MDSVIFEASNVKFEKNTESAFHNIDTSQIEEVQQPTMNGNELPPPICVTQKNFSRLPERSPIDMRFENITFTASLGWRKGKVFLKA